MNRTTRVLLSATLMLLVFGAEFQKVGRAAPSVNAMSPIAISAGTGEKPQSKVWFHDSIWWAVLPTTTAAPVAGTWVWRLDETETARTWTPVLQLSTQTDTQADVKSIGGVAHVLLYGGAPALVSIEYVAVSRTYQPWTTRPTPAALSLGTGTETATLDIDSTGRMWLATESGTEIHAYHSASPYSSFSGPVTVATGVNADDICAVIAMPPNKVGVLWSNQNTKRFGFETHVDGADPDAWSADEVPASQSALNVGLGMADDHLNVKVGSDGTLYAAVKTSYDTGGYPKIALLVRRPSGTWDNLYPVDTAGTRGIVLLDEVHGLVRVVYTDSESGGDILWKESSISAINLTGPSQSLMTGGLNNVTSSKQNWSGRVVVLASSATQAKGVLITRDDPSLVGYWDMDEFGGSTAYDVSGFGNNGALQDDATRGAGVSGQALVLDGGTGGTGDAFDYVRVPNARHLNITNTITLAAWVKPLRHETQNLIKKAVNGTADGFELSLATTKSDTSTKKVFFRLNQATSGDVFRVNSTMEYPIDGTWLHVAGTYDGLILRLYVNGVLDNEVSGLTTIAVNTQDLTIGAQSDGQYGLLGALDDARIYNRALSGAEIAALAGVTVSEADVSVSKTDGQNSVVAGSAVVYTIDVYNAGPTAVAGATVTDALPATLTGATWTCYATSGSTCSPAGAGSISDTVNLAVGGSATYTVNATLSAGASGTLVNTASVSVPGGYSDPVPGNNSATDTDTITGGGVNQAPVVNAGPDQTVTFPASATLAGTVTDDGLPSGTLTIVWTKVSGPGTVTFGTPASASTTAAFSAPGSYVLRLTGDDGALSNYDEVTVTVGVANLRAGLVGYWPMEELSGTTLIDASPQGNNAATTGSPTWAAGKIGSALSLNGSTQYALAPDSASLDLTSAITMAVWLRPTVTSAKTQDVFKKAVINGTSGYEISLSSAGKAFVRFNQVASGDTLRINSSTSYPLNTVWMHVAATYDGTVMRLFINGLQEGELTATFTIATNDLPLAFGAQSTVDLARLFQGQMDDARLYNRALSPGEVFALMSNTAPVVNAGADQAITLPAGASLTGTATDDGLPGAGLATSWTKISGPGTVTFGNTSLLATTAGFSAAGTYVLALSGDDGAIVSTDTLTVTVSPTTAVNTAPVVNAGLDQTVTLPATASLSATATDDGLPNPPATLTTTWSKVSGPGTVTFGNAAALTTTATFGVHGAYVLRLTANDGALSVSDDVTVTVLASLNGGLVGYWRMEEGSGATALVDASGSGNNAAITGTPTWTAGKVGLGLNLTGAQYAIAPNSTSLNITGALTLAAWVKPGVNGTQNLLKKATSNVANTGGYELSLSSSTNPGTVFVRLSNGTTLYRIDSATTYGTTWMHVAATYDGSVVRLYINGTQEKPDLAGPASLRSNAGTALGIGAEPATPVINKLTGQLDEARIYNRALSAAEVSALYTNTAPLVNAGSDRSVTLPGAASLEGTVTDSTLPIPPGAVTAQWSKVSGPGTVTFANAWSATTTAAFSAAGTYVLRLTGDDGMLTASDDVNVTVNPPVPADLPPAAPTLVAPANGSTNVAKPPTLSVTSTDSDSPNLTVKFYGRPKAGPDFTVAVLPDTQNYTASLLNGTPAMFTSQTDWVVANALSRNIAYVAHVGDVTDGNNTTQWGYANTSLSVLEQSLTGFPNGVPYGVSVGNHDGSPGSTTLFNQYFGSDHFAGRSYYGGHYGTDNDNHYDLFSAGGLDFIVVHLESPPATAVLNWADALLTTYSTRRAIIVSHDLIGTGNPGAFSTTGQPIYDALRDNPNIVLMVSGHAAGEGRRSDTYGGSTIHTLLADYQSVGSGGNGWMRVMEFSPANNEIRVKTYSPVLGQWDIDATSQFTLPYAMSSTGAFELLGETTVASGATASLTWPGRADGTEYDWYATVSDTTTTVTSPTWSFTTSAAVLESLSVARAGTGTGSVTSTPAGINCGSACGASYDYNTAVTLTAVAATGSTFTGWTGACTGTGTCVVTMSAAQTVTATFTRNSYTLTVTKAGAGSGAVTSVPSGINCGATCGASYDYNTGVTLTATPAVGSSFTGWSGAGCSGTGTCVVTLSAAQAVTATFTLSSYGLAVTKAGTGTGSVTSTPSGINCPGDCTEAYSYGTSVTLTAAPAVASTFISWSGGVCTGTGTCVVTMDAAKAVTATFSLNTTYYVDNTNASCSDVGAGTSPSLPFCTLTKGANTAVAGDTVRVLAGTYAEVVKPNSGTAGNPVTFSAAPGVTVTGPAGNSTNGGAFRITSKSYIVVDGFTITGTADYGIILDTSNHITLSNNHVSYSGTPVTADPTLHRVGIYLRVTTDSVITGNTTDHNTMDGIRLNSGSNYNTVSNNVSYGNAESDGRNACGINLLANSNYNTIIHNVVYANEDTGLNFYTGSSYNLVVGNLTYGNGDHGIDNNAAPNNVFIGNTVQGNVTVGINIEGASSPGSGGATVINNVMVDNGLLRLVGGGTSAGSAGNIRVDAQSLVGTTLDYNLYYLSPAEGGTAQIYWGGGSAYTSLAVFKAAQPTQEINGLQADPRLAAPAAPGQRPPAAPFNVAINVGDYHLKAGSAAIDSANSSAPNQAAFDIEGHARFDDLTTTDTGAGVRTYDDRGAYEFVGYGLTVTKGGAGSGTVTSAPAGIACGLDCSETYTHGTSVTLTATPAVGSTFTGWTGACTGTGSCVVTMNAAKTVTATFAITTYTLTYTAGTGGTISGTSPQPVNHGASGSLVTAVADAGYHFLSWSDSILTTARTDTNVTANLSVTASFAINEYSVTFDANGGTGSMTVQTRNYNAAAALTANTFSRTGYTFAGWNAAANGSGTGYADGASYGFTANATLYAQWTINQYTVTFDANGGTGSTGPQSANYNVATALTANGFSRTGYTFAGWNTAANGSGTSSADQASYGFTASVTLYAQWTINQYTMTFDSNGGTSVGAITQDFGSAVTAPAA